MKTKYIFLISTILSICLACSEKKEKSEFELIQDKIESGNAKDSDLKKLIEIMSEGEGSYQLISPEAKFKITFPVTNVKESKTVQIIDNKEVEIFHYSANMQGKDHINLSYQINYTFMPEIKSKEDIFQLFNEQRDYILSATNSKLEFEKLISKNGVSGRHIYCTIDESELKLNNKMFFKNGIFYYLSVVTEEGKLFNKSINRFFDSFEITK